MTLVTVPEFELTGPSCLDPTCNGVLTRFTGIRSKESFEKCSKCGQEFNRVTGEEFLVIFLRNLAKVLPNEPDPEQL